MIAKCLEIVLLLVLRRTHRLGKRIYFRSQAIGQKAPIMPDPIDRANINHWITNIGVTGSTHPSERQIIGKLTSTVKCIGVCAFDLTHLFSTSFPFLVLDLSTNFQSFFLQNFLTSPFQKSQMNV